MSDVPWWKSAVIYEIYPRSFQDTDRDGVGDLRGIIARLPYLIDLGVDAIWICPIFPSPMADFGYDVANYVDIDPLFGTLRDFDVLLAEAHRAGLKVLLDLVPNHTSDRHPWFVESRSSRDNGKRDWYLWRDAGADGAVPNNWLSEFGGSAWEFDRRSGQYYYHAFLKQQPDLNWRNPQVRHAIYEAMRFWLRRGVDGFRVDVLWHLIKDDQFRDNPANPAFVAGRPPHEALLPLYTTDRPEMIEMLAEMRDVVDEFGERLLIGEIYLPVERLVAYYGRDFRGVHLPFNFSLLSAPWHAGTIGKLIQEYEAVLPEGGWPNWVLGNHDRPRIAGRVGRQQARIAAMLLPERPPSISATRSAWRRCRYRRTASGIRSKETCPVSRWAVTAAAPPCNGTTAALSASPRSNLGCRWRTIFESTTPSSSAAIQARSITSIAGSSHCGDRGAPSSAAAIARSMPTAICCCSFASRVRSACWSRSTSEWAPALRNFPTSLPERSCCRRISIAGARRSAAA